MITLRASADYVCPWCYIGQNSADRFKKEFGVEVDVDDPPFFRDRCRILR